MTCHRQDGKFQVFTGDQLGALFAARTLRAHRAAGKPVGGHIIYGFACFSLSF
jgi:hypothetical protein